MQDDRIVALYWQRDETAIQETEQKYGRYLFKIANNILSDLEDSEESVNDTYLKAWNSLPPHRPNVLSAYLGKITRQLSIDIFRTRNREKRRATEYAVSLSELGDCVSDTVTTEQTADLHLLAETINTYLNTLSAQGRTTFVGRYYFMDSIKEIADYHGMSESKVKSMLYRTRKGLRIYLEQEGYNL
ncbi:RNA polymerase sigma factor [Lacrimispora sp. NSJ-141]|uniref:RNA polymerase sigma factor n=1 Tax=Lientehia hominis TaxID=2897778 RepID=A0AAP2RHQ1_9FIRM|nr:RNA polymerase sigma factor [Lientehia hominis]MCD2491093.1 RNA polymerase sigma factor [Lientehia hominis]